MISSSKAKCVILELGNVLMCRFVLLLMLLSLPSYSQTPPFSGLNNSQLELQKQLAAPPSWAFNSLDWPALRDVYTANQFSPIWLGDSGFHLNVVGFLGLLKASSKHGLAAKNYHVQSIYQQLTTKQLEERIWLDLLLTNAFLNYVSDISTGRFDPTISDPQWYIQRPTVDAKSLLFRVLEKGSLVATLSDLAPATKEYKNLMQVLQTYQDIQTDGGWTFLPLGPALKLNVWHPHVVLLRERLKAEGELLPAVVLDENLFDEDLEKAVMRFQQRHRLEVDGSVGPKTRAVANLTVEHRVSQIKLNLERQRWLPRSRGEMYVEVNLADFRLDVFSADKSILRMPIIIGKRFHATPAFNNNISYMVVNPEWNIPRRIAKEEMIPAQVRNADTFNRLDIKVLTGWGREAIEVKADEVDWQLWLGSASPYRLVQRASENNSLGRIKFMFHNRFNVYMHDTPHRHLFDRRVRMFSHGCIRVSRPVQLAKTLLNSVPATDSNLMESNFIEREISAGLTKTIRLPKPIPVYLIYKTAWVDEQGRVNFRDDVYGRDGLLMASIVAAKADFKTVTE